MNVGDVTPSVLLITPKTVKVPLRCKIFIAEKGSALLVEKLRGTLSCEQWLHGEKFEDLVAKICRFVISDVIKTGLRQFVVTSQGERK